MFKRFRAYSVRMNSMIDPQNEIETFATVAPEEIYDGPTCDDVAEPVYDDVADDAHQYVDDVYWESVGIDNAGDPSPP